MGNPNWEIRMAHFQRGLIGENKRGGQITMGGSYGGVRNEWGRVPFRLAGPRGLVGCSRGPPRGLEADSAHSWFTAGAVRVRRGKEGGGWLCGGWFHPTPPLIINSPPPKKNKQHHLHFPRDTRSEPGRCGGRGGDYKGRGGGTRCMRGIELEERQLGRGSE